MNSKRKIIFVIMTFTLVLSLASFSKKYDKTNVISQNKIENDKQEKIEKYSSDDTEKETSNNKNKDIVGGIKVDGTNIASLVVQGSDNDYYLDHDFNKKTSDYGSIFMDYRNTLNDRKLLIYGHNSETVKDALFHDLEKYLDHSFYKENKYIELTLNNEKSAYEIFSVMVLPPNTTRHMKITFNDTEWIEHLNWMKKEAVYSTSLEIGVTDKILTLQTCYYNPEGSYLIINAKKI